MTTSVTKPALAATGGVVAAAVSTLCCAGPLVAVALGLSGAGLAATFEPLRPYFVAATVLARSEEHTSELQSQSNLVCRLLLEKKKQLSFDSTPDAHSSSLHYYQIHNANAVSLLQANTLHAEPFAVPSASQPPRIVRNALLSQR